MEGPRFDPATVAPALRRAADALSQRIEESGLNATMPREQLLHDGWLLRWSNDHLLPSRCVIPVSAGRESLDTRLDFCRRWYARQGLPALIRITPFCLPEGLDDALAERGFEAVGEGRVMSVSLADAIELGDTGLHFELADRERFVHETGGRMGMPPQHVDAAAARVRGLALDAMPLLAMHRRRCVGGVLLVLQDGIATLHDLVVDPGTRGLGIGRSLLAAALAAARAHGAGHACAQVDPNNVPARALCARLGFADRFASWYRRAPDDYTA